METLKGPTMNYFALLDEEERQKQISRSTKKSEPKPTPKVTTVPKIPHLGTPQPKLEPGKSNVIEDAPAQLNDRKSDRKTQNRPRPRQINVTRPKARIYDRHSGTGRPPTEIKKGGAGEHNWGGIKDVIDEGLTEEYFEGAPTQIEQPELEQDSTPTTEEKTTNFVSYDQFSAKVAEQQRQLEEKYGSLSTRKVDTSWAKGLVGRKKSVDEGEKSTQELHETSKRTQGNNRKVVNANDLFKIVVPGHEYKGRDTRRRKETQQDRPKQRKGERGERGERVVDTNDKESFPSLTGK